MMRSLYLRRFIGEARSMLEPATVTANAVSSSSYPFLIQSRGYAVSTGEDALPREDPGISHGLYRALAGRGIVVKDKAFHNLKASDLHRKGAITADRLRGGFPLYVRGNISGEASKISKAHFNELLEQVSIHLSSIENVFVQDGVVSSCEKSNAKVRAICDNPTAALTFSNLLWGTSIRAISHDSCPLTVYVSTTISPDIFEGIGIGFQEGDGILVADIERSSLVLCGRAFADTDAVKDALAVIAAPVIAARKGIPLSARLYKCGNHPVLVFAPEDLVQTCSELREFDSGVVLTSDGVAPFYRSRNSGVNSVYKIPTSMVFASADSSGALPLIAKLSPGQAAYHFLAGYQNGKFVPAYCKVPSPIDPLELSKAFLSQLQVNNISSFLINVMAGEKPLTGRKLVKLIESTLSEPAPQLVAKGDLEGKFKSFFFNKFQKLPEEFSF